MDNYTLAQSIQLIPFLWIWASFVFWIWMSFWILIIILFREKRIKRTEMEKVVNSLWKYFWKLKVRAKQKDALIIKKIIEKEWISDDDRYIFETLNWYIYFER